MNKPLMFLRLYAVAIAILFLAHPSFSQDFLISETGPIFACTGTIYDSGGANEDYSDSEEFQLTVCADSSGACLKLEFIQFDLETNWDFLTIYEGTSADGEPLVILTGDIEPEEIDLGVSCMTLVFTSDGSVTRSGFEIAVSCACPSCNDGILNGNEVGIDCGGPDCEPCEEIIMGQANSLVYTCGATLYDNGYTQEYSNNSDDVLTVCADSVEGCIQAQFLSFEVENIVWDQLDVYAGPNTGAPLIGSYGGGAPPPEFISEGTECLTFNFLSDGSVTFPGFEVYLSCSCPSCDDGILNGDELGVDCGGGDCPECDFVTIDDGGQINTCSEIILDSGGGTTYGPNENHTMTFCSEDVSQCLELDFLSLDIENGDELIVYEGTTTDGDVIVLYSDVESTEIIQTTSTCVTFEFNSDDSIEGQGFEAEITCLEECPTCTDGILNGYEVGIDCGGPDCPPCPYLIMGQQPSTVSTCSAILYDNGFDNNYLDNSDDVLTVCAENEDDCMTAAFLLFDINSVANDWLYVYAGSDINAPLIGGYNQGTLPPEVIEAGTECLTFQFVSNGGFNGPGFEIELSCECPSCEDGILNGQEVLIDCGGPDCPPCPINAIDEGGTVTTCETTLFDTGLDNGYGPDENYVMSFCADEADECLKLDFIDLGIAIGDYLYIYDGEGTDGTQLAAITTAVNYEDIYTLGTCATFEFVSNSVGSGTGFEIDISCECATSIDEFGYQQASELSISPNPGDGLLVLGRAFPKGAQLAVYNQDGREVSQHRIVPGVSPLVDIRDLANGVYQIVVLEENRVYRATYVKH